MSRCWAVYRCGLGRLARYSRNLSSGLWDTVTAGNSTTLSPGAAGLHTTGPAHQESLLTTYYKPFAQPVEGGLPFRGGVVGPRGDLPADPLDQVEADALPERRGAGRRPAGARPGDGTFQKRGTVPVHSFSPPAACAGHRPRRQVHLRRSDLRES